MFLREQFSDRKTLDRYTGHSGNAVAHLNESKQAAILHGPAARLYRL